MKPIFLFVLLIFGVCLVVHLNVSKICGGEEYTIVYPNGTFKRCLSCGKCLPGLGLKPECGSTLQHPPSIECHTCKPGEFSREFDSSSCLACHQCAKHELITAHCTNKSDTVCSGKCKEGYYLRKTAPHNCQECSSCCFDGKDENITECINNQGINKHCSARPDKVCDGSSPGATNASKGGGLSTTTVSIIGASIGGVAFVVFVTVALCMYRRRKRNVETLQNVEAQPSPQLPEAPAVCNPDEQRSEIPSPGQASASEGPLAESMNSKVSFTLPVPLENPTYQGSPRGSRNELAGNQPAPSCARKQYSSQNAAAGSKNPVDKSTKLTDEKNSSKPPLGRQVSQDSQTSGDGEDKFRKRSLSVRSFEMVERKMSLKKENSLLESEESDERHAPIKIAKHPKSKTAKEGSKVEFTCICKVEKKNINLLYQWCKDGVEETGQNDNNLVLDPVELRHFGRYTCKVSYQDSYGECVESDPAILAVTPQRRNGIRPKRLDELDINTKDEIASLLGIKKFGLGYWRQVADKYGMNNVQIEALTKSEDPGKDLLEYIIASMPSLTVYDFCKTLKKDKIKRLDIVEKLQDHFLVSESTKNV